MLMLNAENAVVDIRKLRDYCLNPKHPDGKHKSILFRGAIGMTMENADELRVILLEIVKTHDAKLGRKDLYGQRYIIDFPLEWYNRSTVIRCTWMIEVGSTIPRLTSCYPL